jgi:hypothetical protein
MNGQNTKLPNLLPAAGKRHAIAQKPHPRHFHNLLLTPSFSDWANH